MSEEGGFFSRWSRRKRSAREETPAEPEALPAEAVAEAAPAAEPEPEPIELPPLESLTEHSDFRVFLRAGVPDAIRHAALRRLWSLDPAIRDFTNSLDYGWDFNAPDGGMAGFSNTLTGDIEKLLRQAVGMVEEVAREAGPEAESEPDEEAPAAPPLLAAPAPDFIPPAYAPPLPAPAAEEAEPAPLRRRHGGAMPA
jgi:hypothetical protein